MKYIAVFLLGIFSIVACDQPPVLVLEGTLGKSFDSKLVLEQEGDRFSGYFQYLDKPEEKIAVLGTQVGSTLRLEEFNNSEQKLTGVFEGDYNGTTYQGFWTDPAGKNKVWFVYEVQMSTSIEPATKTKGIEVSFQAVAPDEWSSVFYHGLNATVNGQEYTISEVEESYCFNIVDVRDYNGNGIDDALLRVFPTCAGNGQPMQMLYFCTYLPSENRFVYSEEFGSINDDPEIKKEGNNYTVSFTSYSAYSMYRAYETYTLCNGKAVRLEYDEVRPLPALTEIRAEDFTEYEERHGKSMKFDLNGDGELETIKTDYWSRWGLINWGIHFSSGREVKGENSCFRIGVLASKTKGYHDLVQGLDEVLVWNGTKYVKKK